MRTLPIRFEVLGILVFLLTSCGGSGSSCVVDSPTLPQGSLWNLTQLQGAVEDCVSGAQPGDACESKQRVSAACNCYYGTLSQSVSYSAWNANPGPYETALDNSAAGKACLAKLRGLVKWKR